MSQPPLHPNRDSVTTILDDGSRAFLYPADSHGRFTQARQWSAMFLIVLYLALPWIKINGYPAVFLDLNERHFHLFGLTFAAQDLWLIFFLITGVGFSLFFVTALLGRIWCGWACPHTIFLDHVYRRIERWIDGNAVQRRALADAPLSVGKFLKRVLKHSIYLIVSAVITHLFFAYFISLPTVWAMMKEAPAEHWASFAFMAVYTGGLYFNFAWFREQLCIVICPYGRLQSALIDSHSLVVGYDVQRGEPRGKLGALGAGYCISCSRCVHVCPTGIDIRQGLQMECIGCTACIDTCDEVMAKLKRPRGLIRYDSQTAFAGNATQWWRPRTVLYGALLAAGASVAFWAISTIRPANLGITRMTGAPYIVSDDFVRNQFLVRVVNKRNQPARYVLHLNYTPADLQQTGLTTIFEVPALSETVQPLVLQLARKKYTGPFILEVRVEDETEHFHLERDVEFLGPEATGHNGSLEQKREHKDPKHS